MYKLTFEHQGKEHISYYDDLHDAQEQARYIEIHLGVPRNNIWINIEY